MHYINGEIKINGTQENAETVLDFLRNEDRRFIFCSIWKHSNGAYYIDMNFEGQDINETLSSLVDFAKKEQIDATFDVRFTGTDVGGYVYSGDGLQCLSETDCFLHDASDEDLIRECKRRGLTI